MRRTKPSRKQTKNLTAFERATGWRCSIIVTNIPDTGIKNVPGTHHPQFTDILHRDHAIVEDQMRTNKAMGLRNLLGVKDLAGQLQLGAGGQHRRRPVRLVPLLGLYDQEASRTQSRTRCATFSVGAARPHGPPCPRPRAEDQPTCFVVSITRTRRQCRWKRSR